MDNVSLVPVDYQPEFENVSLVPVDYEPFADDGATPQSPTRLAQTESEAAPSSPQQAQTQPAQSQPEQPPTGIRRIYINTRAKDAQASDEGESWDPDSENGNASGPSQPTQSSAAPTAPLNNVPFTPFGELKPITFPPTQQIGYYLANKLIDRGMNAYKANDLISRLGNVLNLLPPVGIAGSTLDLIDAKRRDDLPGVVTAAAGLIPGAKGIARGARTWLFEHHHPWPMYLGGAVEQELVRLPRSAHIEYHRRLDIAGLPRWRGTAHYESLGPAEKQEVLQTLAEQTKKFDADHGTQLYDALLKELKNGFPEP